MKVSGPDQGVGYNKAPKQDCVSSIELYSAPQRCRSKMYHALQRICFAIVRSVVNSIELYVVVVSYFGLKYAPVSYNELYQAELPTAG